MINWKHKRSRRQICLSFISKTFEVLDDYYKRGEEFLGNQIDEKYAKGLSKIFDKRNRNDYYKKIDNFVADKERMRGNQGLI